MHWNPLGLIIEYLPGHQVNGVYGMLEALMFEHVLKNSQSIK